MASVLNTVIAVAEGVFESPVRPDDTFFDLGADSLRIVEFAQRLEDRLGVPVDLDGLVSGDPIEKFVGELDRSLPEAPRSAR
ncbi:acyl carrier protein [Streptomyces sp. NBRC 109706]|uniref:acyl carrier protein n=1 Tax=Streptomyces sp. NBRC 109706 TaxID=1550035 RepID=UPI000785401F|nr:acyl carrier protein [Streptomyces sp. NBRC 109706]